MKQEHIDLLKETLQQYGSDFDGENVISELGNKLIQVQLKRGKFYFLYSDVDAVVASSPITKAGIEKFVESIS